MVDVKSTVTYVKVTDDEGDDPCGIPSEFDGTLLLSSVHAMFPGCTGLKYKISGSACTRGVRVSSGILSPPEEGWEPFTFICVYPKDNKRKGEIESNSSSAKSKRIDLKKCTDLIVLGLPWKTDDDALHDYFSEFGELVMAQIKLDSVTNKSKGFGFIRFSDFESQVMCLAQSQHTIQGRHVDVRLPISKGEGDRQEISKKIFVGHLTEEITEDLLKEHFSTYGKINDVFVPKPFRKFAFVTFDELAPVHELLKDEHFIDEVKLNVSTAVPKLSHQDNYGGGGFNKGNQNFRGYNQNDGRMRGDFHKPSQQWGAGYNDQQHGGYGGQSNQRFNNGNSLGGMSRNNQPMGPSGDNMSQNTAALAALNMLNNPNVVAAIMNAAGQAGFSDGGGQSNGSYGNQYQGNRGSRNQ